MWTHVVKSFLREVKTHTLPADPGRTHLGQGPLSVNIKYIHFVVQNHHHPWLGLFILQNETVPLNSPPLPSPSNPWQPPFHFLSLNLTILGEVESHNVYFLWLFLKLRIMSSSFIHVVRWNFILNSHILGVSKWLNLCFGGNCPSWPRGHEHWVLWLRDSAWMLLQQSMEKEKSMDFCGT